MEGKKKKKKKLAYFVASPNRCKGMHEAKIIHVKKKKHIPQDTIFICNFYKNYLQVY